jgi:hypothetical protein
MTFRRPRPGLGPQAGGGVGFGEGTIADDVKRVDPAGLRGGFGQIEQLVLPLFAQMTQRKIFPWTLSSFFFFPVDFFSFPLCPFSPPFLFHSGNPHYGESRKRRERSRSADQLVRRRLVKASRSLIVSDEQWMQRRP